MYKVMGCWSPPAVEQKSAFERMYVSHCEAACLLPGLREYSITTFDTDAIGLPRAPTTYYRHAEMVFDSRQAAIAALKSPAAQRLYYDTSAIERRFGSVATVLGMGPTEILLSCGATGSG